MPESYRIVGIMSDVDIPDWQRKPPKWTQLVDEVIKLEPGKSLVLEFDDLKTATRARNAVRDVANLRMRSIVVRTRLVEEPDGKVRLWLIRVTPEQGEPPPPKKK